MDRINTDTKAVDLFGAGKHGFRNGDLSIGVYPTDLDEDWFNGAQEELMSVIEDAGVVPDIAVHTKVKQAIKRLFGGNITTVNAANSPLALTADNAGLVIMDATGGNISATLPAANAVTGAPLRFKFVRMDASANTATINRAGADTFVNGGTSFALVGLGDYRAIESNAGALWAITSKAGQSSLAALVVTVAANALTCNLAGEDVEFRSDTLTSGVPVRRSATATAIVVPSGATLGTVAAVQSRIVWGWIDSAGTPEPFVVNIAGGVNLDETTLISTTALSAAADSANVFYSTTARANVAFRVRGFCDITEAVPGTWATAPTLVQPAGGQALATMSSLGYGQTWQNVTGSRAGGTTYYNTTGKPIAIMVMPNANVNSKVTLTVNGVVAFDFSLSASNTASPATAIIPPGASYVATFTGTTLVYWAELR